MGKEVKLFDYNLAAIAILTIFVGPFGEMIIACKRSTLD